MARRRKPGPRTRSDRLSRAFVGPARDAGTTEAQAKRQALVGQDADPSLSASAPGILFARSVIDRDQYGKALLYRRLRCAIFGSPFPSKTTGNEASDTSLAKVKRVLAAIEATITHEQRLLVASVCVFDVLPHSRAQITTLATALDAMLGRTSYRDAA